MVEVLATAMQHLGKASRASVAASCREPGMPDAAAQVVERKLAQAQCDLVRAVPGIPRGVTLPGEDCAGTEAEG